MIDIQIFSIIVNIALLAALGSWISIAYRWKRLFLEERKQKVELWKMYLDIIGNVNGMPFNDWISKILDDHVDEPYAFEFKDCAATNEENEMTEEQNGK